MSIQHHEDFSRDVRAQGPSDRNFGWVFTVAFLLIGILPLLHRRPIRPIWLVLSGAVLLVTLFCPALFRLPNRLWTRIGRLLGKVMNPVATGLLFFTVFTPAAMILRWRKKDPLTLARDPNAETYWIPRTSGGETGSMVNQF